MSAPQISRRTLLQGSGVAAGGLALGVSIPLAATPQPTSEAKEINAFVHIADDGATTIYCGRCEMGQGISTALPQAVADELEADWSRVTVLQGDADEKYGPQATGGSRSINEMFQPMRAAGAAAREMLVTAAAARWGIPASDCYAEQHRVRNRQNQRSLSYGELVAEAADLSVPAQPTLKQPQQFRYIGQPLPRHDMSEVVVGERTYGADVRVPGMKYAAIRHVPVLGGAIKSYDATEAKALPGVIDVIQIDPIADAYSSLGGIAVIADTTWQAKQALDRINIEFDAGPNGSYDSKAYKEELVRQVEQPAEKVHEKGNIAAAFEAAASTHKATFTGGHLSHSPMEPMASTVAVR
ncbi:MAG: molybdopterin-dependent oxidoreductase, partial [Xanthomonadales bacterium]|nr:molybdopterin-dependent oxidoreductase [Xanthomonadales bacterium]